MTPEELRNRTRAFGLRIIRLTESLPRSRTADVIGRQVLRCGVSVGANYRAACRARSPADFVAKMHIVQEEADESLYWMELLTDANVVEAPRVADLMREANELLAIFVASINTARGRPRGRGKRGLPVERRQSAIRNPQSAMRDPKSEMV